MEMPLPQPTRHQTGRSEARTVSSVPRSPPLAIYFKETSGNVHKDVFTNVHHRVIYQNSILKGQKNEVYGY
jgi:hypothetical protein